MTREEYLALCSEKYEELQHLNNLNDFYDYEVGFLRIWKAVGREVLEKNIGQLSNDKRKKKPHDSWLYNDK